MISLRDARSQSLNETPLREAFQASAMMFAVPPPDPNWQPGGSDAANDTDLIAWLQDFAAAGGNERMVSVLFMGQDSIFAADEDSGRNDRDGYRRTTQIRKEVCDGAGTANARQRRLQNFQKRTEHPARHANV